MSEYNTILVEKRGAVTLRVLTSGSFTSVSGLRLWFVRI